MIHNKVLQSSKNIRWNINSRSSTLLGNVKTCYTPLFTKKEHFPLIQDQRGGFASYLYNSNSAAPSSQVVNTPSSSVSPNNNNVSPTSIANNNASSTASTTPLTVVQTSVVDGVVSTNTTNTSLISTSNSQVVPGNTAATIVIIQQPSTTTSSRSSPSENVASGGINDQIVSTPSLNQQQTIIQIDTQVFSKQIEQVVKQQMKQNLTKIAYEPTGEESFEIMEHLERERLYENGKGKGWIYQFKRFMKKKTSLLTNLLAVGKVLPANAIMSLFFSFHKMEQNYKERIFAQRITASLNFIDKKTNTFKIRNIFCKNLDEVVLNNQAVVQVIQEAALKTTKEAPIVILPDEDKWFILNLVQSCISQNVASGYFRQDMMLKHHSEWYVFAITNETDVSIRKMRVVIAQEKLLKAIHEGTVNQPEFEHVYGEIRWNTVKLMSKMYHEQYNAIMESKLNSKKIRFSNSTVLLSAGFGDLQRVEVVLSGSL